MARLRGYQRNVESRERRERERETPANVWLETDLSISLMDYRAEEGVNQVWNPGSKLGFVTPSTYKFLILTRRDISLSKWEVLYIGTLPMSPGHMVTCHMVTCHMSHGHMSHGHMSHGYYHY